jgi:hypothetical protein
MSSGNPDAASYRVHGAFQLILIYRAGCVDGHEQVELGSFAQGVELSRNDGVEAFRA